MSKPAVIHFIKVSTSESKYKRGRFTACLTVMTTVRCGQSNYLSASSAPEHVTCKRCRKLMEEVKTETQFIRNTFAGHRH